MARALRQDVDLSRGAHHTAPPRVPVNGQAPPAGAAEPDRDPPQGGGRSRPGSGSGEPSRVGMGSRGRSGSRAYSMDPIPINYAKNTPGMMRGPARPGPALGLFRYRNKIR